MSSTPKLTKAQQDLYDAMKQGAVCHFMPYMGRFNPNPYYFNSANLKHCTAAARALLKLGLVEEYATDWRGHKLRVPSTKEQKP